MRKWRQPFPDKNLGTLFGVKDAAHPNGHRGVDYNKLKVGTALPCVANDATFIKAYWSDALGHIAVYQVGKWFISYCHMLEASKIKPGTKLKSGQSVGKLGNSGSATSGAHLHAVLGQTENSAVSGRVFDLHKFIQEKMKEEADEAISD